MIKWIKKLIRDYRTWQFLRSIRRQGTGLYVAPEGTKHLRIIASGGGGGGGGSGGLGGTIIYSRIHDEYCDVDPKTLTWNRVRYGESQHICMSCWQQISLRPKISDAPPA